MARGSWCWGCPWRSTSRRWAGAGGWGTPPAETATGSPAPPSPPTCARADGAPRSSREQPPEQCVAAWDARVVTRGSPGGCHWCLAAQHAGGVTRGSPSSSSSWHECTAASFRTLGSGAAAAAEPFGAVRDGQPPARGRSCRAWRVRGQPNWQRLPWCHGSAARRGQQHAAAAAAADHRRST
jgi:hypothetical protein